MNNDLIRLIEKSYQEINKNFNKMLDDFLGSIDGYNQLDVDGKSICKIFLCLNIIIKLERKGEKVNECI